MKQNNSDWSKRLVNLGILKSSNLIKSFSTVKREDFIPSEYIEYAYIDSPIEIGHGQTNSQPSLVASMLELLSPKLGHSILDVGCGSGWTTALLTTSVGPKGKVIGTERIPSLVNFAKNNLKKYKYKNVEIKLTRSEIGLEELGPYYRILVSANLSKDLLPLLTKQLKDNGLMVAPIRDEENSIDDFYNQSIYVITKTNGKVKMSKAIDYVAFVPLIYYPKT